MENKKSFERILSIDIGGSKIKATILDKEGELTIEYKKIITPSPSTPANVLDAIIQLTSSFPSFDCISVGFPGYIKNGRVITAPNLGTTEWSNEELEKNISERFSKPVKVVNDADMQGLGVVEGDGLEMVITLGTGFGTALLLDGVLLPHFEIAHHPIKKDIDYDGYIGDAALEKIGVEKWNKRMKKVIGILKTVFNYDHLYIGGGNAKKIDFSLDENISLISNKDGIKGGARLWKNHDAYLTSVYSTDQS